MEVATCDANGEFEEITGWLTCFDEVFDSLEEVVVFGDAVSLVGFDCIGTTLVAVCSKGKYRGKVTLDSISLRDPTKAQKLWLKAWNLWKK